MNLSSYVKFVKKRGRLDLGNDPVGPLLLKMSLPSMAAMLASAKPLIAYFENNNAAVLKFNNTLGTFKTTITHVVDTMDMLKGMSEMVLPSVDELEAGFDKAEEAVLRFDEALLKHLGVSTKGHEAGSFKIIDEEAFSSNIITAVNQFSESWALVEKGLGESFKTFEDGADTITELISSINSLVSAFETLQDLPIVASEQIVAGFEKIKDTINEVNEAMKTFATEGLSELVSSLASVAAMWTDWDAKLDGSDNTFSEAVTRITALASAISSLIDVQAKLADMDIVSDTNWTSFFKTISDQIHEVGEGMLTFTEDRGLTSLTNNLGNVEKIWTRWTEEMGNSLTTFNDTSTGIGGLASSVLGLVGAFTSLAEMPIMTADAFSAGMKDMVTNIENFASALKDNISAIEKALEAVDEAWADHAKSMETLVPVFDGATTAINTLAGGILSLVRSFESLKELDFEKTFSSGFKNLTEATSAFGAALANNIDDLMASLNRLISTWMENEAETVRLMRGFVTIANNFLIVIGYANELQFAFDRMTAGSGKLGDGFSELTGFMNAVIKGVSEIYTTESAVDLAQFVIDVGLVVSALGSLEEKIDTVMAAIEQKTNDTVDSMKTKILELGGMGEDAFKWGANLIISFVNGMKSEVWYLEEALNDIAQTIENFLGVGSNTKLGALSHLTDWPENLVSTFAEGLRKGVPDMAKALSALTLPAENLHMPTGYAGMLGTGGNTVTFYNTWHVGNQKDVDYAITEMEQMLTRKRVI